MTLSERRKIGAAAGLVLFYLSAAWVAWCWLLFFPLRKLSTEDYPELGPMGYGLYVYPALISFLISMLLKPSWRRAVAFGFLFFGPVVAFAVL